ncbi:unnamed protein product [Oikopleura dioica]|uniref:PDZ domain-containing protein n=1 Tax=Oikopleura dioica TaxID=34765 RepID=E4X735_OIKDI|nr:unnamed protein product [Oikopleura dioica]
MTHAKVHENHIEMTVIDPAALKLFQKLSIKITTELAELLASFKIMKRQLSEPPQYEEATAPEPELEEPEPEVEEPEPEVEEEDDKLIEHPALAAAAIAKARADSDEPAPLPRLVTLKDNNGYGFFLQDKDGDHFLTDVEEGEAAQLAGIRDNDRIVQVNNKSVEGAKHSVVVDLIRLHTDKVTFLVCDKECDDYYKARDVKITKALLGIEPRARLIRVKKIDGTFGFEMHTEPFEAGRVQLLRNIVEGGPADQAGLEEHDRVLEINGQTLDDVSHEDAVDIIRNSGNTVVFLVADEECTSFFAAKSITITRDHANELESEEEEPELEPEEEPEPEKLVEHPIAAAAAVAAIRSKVEAELEVEEEPEPEPEEEKIIEHPIAAAAIVAAVRSRSPSPEPEPIEEPEPEPEPETTYESEPESESERKIEHPVAAVAAVAVVRRSPSPEPEPEAEPEPEVHFEEPEPSINGNSVAESVAESTTEPEPESEPEAPSVSEVHETNLSVAAAAGIYGGHNNAVPVAAATVAAVTAEKTVALQEEPDVSAGLTVAMARQMKIFGTVKSFKVNPRARVDQVPLVNKTPAPQSAYSAPTPAPAPVAPASNHVVVKPAAAAAIVVASSQPQTSKPRAPAGNSIRDLMNRFQTNGQMLTGGQMPEQGVPEQQSVKIIAAKTTVEGNASAGVIGVAVKQQPKSPEPVVNKVMRPNISEVNKMASGEAAPAAPVPPPQMYGQPQFQPAPQQFQQYPMYPQSPQGGYQPFPVQPFPVQPQYGQPYGQPQPGYMPYMPPQQGFYPPPPPQQQQQQQPQYR